MVHAAFAYLEQTLLPSATYALLLLVTVWRTWLVAAAADITLSSAPPFLHFLAPFSCATIRLAVLMLSETQRPGEAHEFLQHQPCCS